MFKPTNNILTDHSEAPLLLWILFVICVSCHTVLSVPCSLVVTCWERDDILTLLNHVMFSCVLSLSHIVSWVSVPGVVFVLIPDLCLLLYFVNTYELLVFSHSGGTIS